MATTVHEAGRRIALDEIRVPENVPALDESHVQALAGSIKLQGLLVPLVVRDDGDGFELVAAFTGSPPHGHSAWPTSLSSSGTPRARMPTARSRTSPHADVGMT
jgi:hypothetical protein